MTNLQRLSHARPVLIQAVHVYSLDLKVPALSCLIDLLLAFSTNTDLSQCPNCEKKTGGLAFLDFFF